ncbi:MAG: hypothetical protein M3379_16640, partial [Acidobacteriota bacterium]|nr:hypothetical protein [Acidobacteriota bacterium]
MEHGTSLLLKNGASEKEWGRTGKRRGRRSGNYPARLVCLFAGDDYAKRAVQVNTILYKTADALPKGVGVRRG